LSALNFRAFQKPDRSPGGKPVYGGLPQMTQIEQARAGVITPEMQFVAKREDLATRN
jgi:hypothetical protein